MKLLCVIPEYPPDFGGGIATYYGHLLPALARRGISVTAIVGSSLSATARPRDAQGVRIIPLDPARVARLAPQFHAFSLAPDFCHHLAAAWAAWEQAGGGDGYDHVECADWGLSFVPWLTRADAPPTTVRLHASIGQIARHDPQHGHVLNDALSQLLETLFLPRATELVTYGAGNQAWWKERLHRDVSLRPPPFPLPPDNQAARPAASEYGLVAGRVQPWKGPATLCRALRVMGNAAPVVEWFGRSTRTADGIETAERLRADFPEVWGSRILSRPSVQPDALRSRQMAARFVAVPSDWDVFNYTAAEAMAVGAPLVCSDGAGAAGLVRDGENGFTFPAGDHAALADRLRTLLALSPAKRADLGRAARQTIAATLDPDHIASLEHDALTSAASPTPHPAPDIATLFTPAATPSGASPRSPVYSGLDRIPLSALIRHVRDRVQSRVFRRP